MRTSEHGRGVCSRCDEVDGSDDDDGGAWRSSSNVWNMKYGVWSMVSDARR